MVPNWLGRPATVGLPPATPMPPPAPIPATPIPLGPVPAAPIPVASIPAADAPPVRAKPAQVFHPSEQRGKPQCCPHPCWSRSRYTHSCSWRTASQSQTCTQVLHPCEQRGKPQCCQPTSKSIISSWLNFDGSTANLVLLNSIIYVQLSSKGTGSTSGHWALCCLWVRVMFIMSTHVNLHVRPCILVCAFL